MRIPVFNDTTESHPRTTPAAATEDSASSNHPSTESSSAPTGSATSPEHSASPKPKSVLIPTRKRRITILLIGETGSGKTSFMSLLMNLFQGCGPLELEEKNDVRKESGLDKSQSQTTKATLYTITTSDGTEIRILDTPGLADTRGLDQDNKHKAEINNAIKQHITTIDAVIIMANGTVERLAAATDYTLNVITSMFPRSIIDNIGFIFTNSDPLTWNFQTDSLPPELRKSQHWLLQNPLSLYKNYKKQEASGGQGNLPKQSQMHRKLEAAYDDVVESLNQWLQWLDKRDVQPTKDIDRLYQMSVGIEANIEAALSAITRSTEQRLAWERIQYDLQNAKNRKAACEAAKVLQTSPVWEREPSDSIHTVCIAPNCYSNCHSPCGLSFTDGSSELERSCVAFDCGDPIRCETCHHLGTDHRHYRHIHVLKPRAVDPDTMRNLENAETDEQKLNAAQIAAQNGLKMIENDIKTAGDEIRRLVEDYNQISLSRNFAGHVRSAIQMLELRREELGSKPGTEPELALIDESLARLRERLKILGENSTGGGKGYYDKIKRVFRSS